MTRRLPTLAAAALLVIACAGCSSGEADSGDEASPRVGVDVWSKFDGAADRLAGLLQPRETLAVISVPARSTESIAVAAKLKQTAEADPRTFLHLMRDNATDGVPNYDPRLGITTDEYDFLLHGTHLRLKKLEEVPLTITVDAEQRYHLRGLPGLIEVTVEPTLTLVSTPYGDVTRPEEFAAAASPELTGSLVGYRWTQPPIAGDVRRYRIRELTLAQSTDDGAVWFTAIIVDTLDNRRPVDYYARFGGPTE